MAIRGGDNVYMLICIKCGGEIVNSKSVKYCSPRCSRLFLKAQYNKRHPYKKIRKERTAESAVIKACYFCRKTKKLKTHHIEYEPEIMIKICDQCHHKIHRIIDIKNLIEKYKNV